MTTTQKFRILSCKYSRGSYLVWWRDQAHGYTEWLDEAGVFTKEKAESHCRGSHGDAVPVPCERVFTTHQVVPLDADKVGDLFEVWRKEQAAERALYEERAKRMAEEAELRDAEETP